MLDAGAPLFLFRPRAAPATDAPDSLRRLEAVLSIKLKFQRISMASICASYDCTIVCVYFMSDFVFRLLGTTLRPARAVGLKQGEGSGLESVCFCVASKAHKRFTLANQAGISRTCGECVQDAVPATQRQAVA